MRSAASTRRISSKLINPTLLPSRPGGDEMRAMRKTYAELLCGYRSMSPSGHQTLTYGTVGYGTVGS